MAEKHMTARQIERLKDKLHRLAYELEYDASRTRGANDSLSNSLKAISERLGELGRS